MPTITYQQIIEAVCQNLRIQPPSVILRSRKQMPTETTLAMISSDGASILLRRDKQTGYDAAFAIAHELRHRWQQVYANETYYSDYRTITDCADLDEYNLQPAEIDANAYAFYFMDHYFGVQPTGLKLSEKVIHKILQRKREIEKE